ncbi:MAG: branched-chain amino acid transport system ATP-binding protein [Alphaproteobacteria bacterium]|jgi:branched-chain amino acid transport system ATP-binding protein|nr:branched-chain amino acid transport system ATP-binding protein [Alphaproteobacteria bacterium]
MLELRELHVAYGAISVVKSLSFTLREGEILAVLGPNGAGKTSSVEAIAGLAPKRAGRVTLDGVDISNLSADRVARRGIALVPQWRELFPDFTVEETLIAGAHAAGDRTALEMDVVYVLFPRLAERRRQAAGALSGGEQQMLTIGRALMSRPRFILLDEPSAGLSVAIVRNMVDAIDKIRKNGVGIVLVEQNLEIAAALAANCIVLATGKVSWEGAIGDLLEQTTLRQAYFG